MGNRGKSAAWGMRRKEYWIAVHCNVELCACHLLVIGLQNSELVAQTPNEVNLARYTA